MIMDTMLKRHFLKLNRREKVEALKRVAAGSLALIREYRTEVEFFTKVPSGWRSETTGKLFRTQEEVLCRPVTPGTQMRTVFFEDFSQTQSN